MLKRIKELSFSKAKQRNENTKQSFRKMSLCFSFTIMALLELNNTVIAIQ
jgi:hypothetical protein